MQAANDSTKTHRVCVGKWFRLLTNEEVFVSAEYLVNTCSRKTRFTRKKWSPKICSEEWRKGGLFLYSSQKLNP